MLLLPAVDGPPLRPSADQARQWVVDELAKPDYQNQRSLLERFLDWLRELLSGLGSGSGAPPWVALLIALGLVGLAVVGLLRVRGRRRAGGAARQRGGALFDEGPLSAAEYRQRATLALAGQRWDDALLDAVRALAAGAIERVLLDDLPGRTAHELGVALGPVFPQQRFELLALVERFDGIRYGDRHADEAAARAAVALESTVAQTRPLLPGAAAAGVAP